MALYRTEKINNEIKRELSSVIRDLKDPRIPALTSIIKVDVTKDLKYGKIYVSAIGTAEQRENAVKGLNNAKGFLRTEIGRRLKIRTVPEFTFILDNSIEYGAHINDVINKINRGE